MMPNPLSDNWRSGRHQLLSFPAHGFRVVTALLIDADRIVTGSDDRTILIHDISTGALRKQLQCDGGVWCMQAHGDNTLVSGGTDRTVQVWDMELGICTHVLEGHTATVRGLVILTPVLNESTGVLQPDVPLIVSASRDSTIRVWRLPVAGDDNSETATAAPTTTKADSPFLVHVLKDHTDAVRFIAGHGNTLVSGSYDTTVRIWDVTTGTARFVCQGHKEKVYSVAYSHELERAASGSMDSSVKIWCTRTGEQLYHLEGHTSLVGLLQVSTKYLVSASADATLRIWSLTGQNLATLTGHRAAITSFHHDPARNRIVSGADGGVKLWELHSENEDGVAHGRFVRNFLEDVQGVWRVTMDWRRMVCAVQRAGGATWLEVLDFGAETAEGADGVK